MIMKRDLDQQVAVNSNNTLKNLASMNLTGLVHTKIYYSSVNIKGDFTQICYFLPSHLMENLIFKINEYIKS